MLQLSNLEAPVKMDLRIFHELCSDQSAKSVSCTTWHLAHGKRAKLQSVL